MTEDANDQSWDAPHPLAGHHVLRSQQELSDLWVAHGGVAAEQPQVDFARHMVICVFVDEGEYEECPAIERIEESGGELAIHVGRFRRPWKMINPAAVLKVPRFDGACRFIDREKTA
jgi:hypothetical protein